MANKTWVRRFAWWRRGKDAQGNDYVDDEGFIRMEMHPDILDWCISVNRNTYTKEAQDVAARMFALAPALGNLTAQQLWEICQNKEFFVERGKKRVLKWKEGFDSDGNPAWLITAGIEEDEE